MAKQDKGPGRKATANIKTNLTKPQGPAKPRGEQRIAGATGASDATSGGGAGAGIPDADLQMRTRGAVNRGDVQRDRQRLFPETRSGKNPSGGTKKPTQRRAGKK